MKYDFTKIKIKDIGGKEIKSTVHETLANYIYQLAKDLDLVEMAREIFAGKEVELDKTEVEKIVEMVKSDQAPIAAFAKKAIIDYIDSVKESKKEPKKEQE